MRIVAWNLAHKRRSWPALDALSPDIAMLNEAEVPPERRGIWSRTGTEGRDGRLRPWTAAVVTDHPCAEITDTRPRWRQSVRAVPFTCSRPGSWVAATVQVGGRALTVVSVYGLMDEFSDASVHRSLSELSPVFDDPRYKRDVIIGGDLNTGTQWRKGDPFNERDRNVLERFAAYGLVDCLAAKRPAGRLEGCACTFGDQCTHTRTRRDGRYPLTPFQTDYLFASKSMAARLVSCQALTGDEWFAVSDHAPIVADFE
jgi:endonuclease/exonuclease/phosphatase family metal-dependent hydrolase